VDFIGGFRELTTDISQKRRELEALVARILWSAKRKGATAAEVSASFDTGLSVSVREGDVETVEFNQDRGFGITVYVGQRRGSASTSDNSEEAVESTISKACEIARFTEEDPHAGLAPAELMAGVLPELECWHPRSVTSEEAATLALSCEAAALRAGGVAARGAGAAGGKVRSDGASLSTHESLRVYGNSHGFTGFQSGTRFGLSCMTIAADAAGGMQRDYWYTVGRRFEDLESPESVGERATQRALRRLSPRKAPTGKFPVAYVPEVSSGLISHLLGALSGGALYRKASYLLDSLGQPVLPGSFNIVESPHLRGALGSAAYDGDGVATRQKRFVLDGVVQSYVLSAYSARQLGLVTTGNAGGVHNVEIEGPTATVADIYRKMQRGLLVTECMGQGVNLVTGDYSRGASGFWIENGEVQYPVDEVTIASNLRAMLLGVVAVGDDVDRRGNLRTPTILLSEMTVGGTG
jgi:PmbA protein